MNTEELGRKYPIVMAEYDPQWPARFEEEARYLTSRFGPNVISRVEHFGSTAVPGLAAKPVIDILVEVPSFEVAEREIRPPLESKGYTYIWRPVGGSDGSAGHIMFVKGYGPDGYLDGVQRYHLHLAPADNPIWERLLFRDHLRSHPNDAERYAALKRRLARLHRNDRETYTAAKTDFFTEIGETSTGLTREHTKTPAASGGATKSGHAEGTPPSPSSA
jgi:GrpB-like predicted nucleotidyltransferase (UPF0157 family)